MLFPSKSPLHCGTKTQKQSDKLYNLATLKNLIESDRVLKRAQKKQKSSDFQHQKLVYTSLPVHFSSAISFILEERGPHFFMQQRYYFLISLPNKTEISHNYKVLLS